MASQIGYYDSEMLNTDCEDAVKLYGKMGEHIRSLASLNANAKFKSFLHKWFSGSSAEILKDLERAAQLYDEAELSGRNYARAARNFAEENILVADGILEGKKHYGPEDMIETFEDMVNGLLEDYNEVITKYNKVVDLMAQISGKTGRAKDRTQLEVREAEDGIVRHAPILGPFVGAAEGAVFLAKTVDNIPMKAVLGFVGAIAGTIKGAISSALIVPMVYNITERAKYEELNKELDELASEVGKVEFVIKNHRELLIEISSPVKNLSQKYKSIKGRKTLRIATLDRIKKESNELIKACDRYLVFKVPYSWK